MEQLTNNGSTTLSASLGNSATSLTVTDASQFPSVGNFTIRIENELVKVTAVSGTTFTIVRGQEGTSAANHANSSAVNFSLTKGSLNRVIGEYSLVGNGTDRPTADYNGRAYIHTDQPLTARVVNGSWKTFHGSFGPFTPTQSGNFTTWVNQSTYGYVTNATDSWLLGDTGGDSGDQPRMRVATITGDASLELAFLCFRNPQADNNQFGIVVRESSSGKHYRVCFQNTDSVTMAFAVYRYTDTSTFDTTLIAQVNVIWGSQPVFLKVEVLSGTTTIKISGSPDFVNWREMYSFSYSGFFTPNQMGPYTLNYSTPTGIDCFMNILSSVFTP